MREQVGLPITVGVARTKFLAKVASAGRASRTGCCVVPPAGELAFLHPLPVERLWGVGAVTAGEAARHGLATVADVAELGEPALVSLLGPARRAAPASRWRWAAIRGRCRSGSGAGRWARSGRWASRPRTPAEVEALLAGLVDRVMRRMRAAHRVGRTVVLRLRFDDFSRATRSHTLAQATARTDAVLEAARHCSRGARP